MKAESVVLFSWPRFMLRCWGLSRSWCSPQSVILFQILQPFCLRKWPYLLWCVRLLVTLSLRKDLFRARLNSNADTKCTHLSSVSTNPSCFPSIFPPPSCAGPPRCLSPPMPRKRLSRAFPVQELHVRCIEKCDIPRLWAAAAKKAAADCRWFLTSKQGFPW